jgi:hypothetical protein
MGAMESQMNKNMKAAKMKERMRAKFEQKTASTPTTPSPDANVKPQLSEEELIKIFSSGEKAEKTPRGAKPPVSQGQPKKKKGKK